MRIINLIDSKVSDEGAARLQKLLPGCSILHPSLPTTEANQRAAQWAIDNGASLVTYTGTPFQKLPQQPFTLKLIAFQGENPPSVGSANLQGLRNLENLFWPGLTTADIELNSIEKLTTLRALNIASSDVSAVGLAQLKNLLQLEDVNLSFCQNLSDEAFFHLASSKHLRHLIANETPITDKGLKALSELKNLRRLRLEGCKNITDDGLAHLVSLKKLLKLGLAGIPLTDAAIPHLQQMKSLRVLDITNTLTTPAAAAKLQAALPDCVIFHESLNDVPWQPVLSTTTLSVIHKSTKRLRNFPATLARHLRRHDRQPFSLPKLQGANSCAKELLRNFKASTWETNV